MMATQEYEGMKEQLDLEQNLRVQAETYAHEVGQTSIPPPPCLTIEGFCMNVQV